MIWVKRYAYRGADLVWVNKQVIIFALCGVDLPDSRSSSQNKIFNFRSDTLDYRVYQFDRRQFGITILGARTQRRTEMSAFGRFPLLRSGCKIITRNYWILQAGYKASCRKKITIFEIQILNHICTTRKIERVNHWELRYQLYCRSIEMEKLWILWLTRPAAPRWRAWIFIRNVSYYCWPRPHRVSFFVRCHKQWALT